MCETNQNIEDVLVCNNVQEQYEGEKGMTIMAESETTALRLHTVNDFRRHEKGKAMSFSDLLLIKYGNSKIVNTIRARRRTKVHGGTMYSWHDEGFEEEERLESGLDERYYDLPQVYVETFEVKVLRNDLKGDGHRRKCPKGGIDPI
ncbi:hypothetical protein Tco_0344697 [Tanacetum coccineum]